MAKNDEVAISYLNRHQNKVEILKLILFLELFSKLLTETDQAD